MITDCSCCATGLSKDSPPPEPEMPEVPPGGPPRSQPDGEAEKSEASSDKSFSFIKCSYFF